MNIAESVKLNLLPQNEPSLPTPALIARCVTSEDVTRAVDFAWDHQALFSIRGGGHNLAGSGVEDRGVTIDLSGMKRVEVERSDNYPAVTGGKGEIRPGQHLSRPDSHRTSCSDRVVIRKI